MVIVSSLILSFYFLILLISCYLFIAKGLNSGAVFVYYNPTGEHWTLNVTFPSPAGFNGHFGFDVDISPSYVIIGAYGFSKYLV